MWYFSMDGLLSVLSLLPLIIFVYLFVRVNAVILSSAHLKYTHLRTTSMIKRRERDKSLLIEVRHIVSYYRLYYIGWSRKWKIILYLMTLLSVMGVRI